MERAEAKSTTWRRCTTVVPDGVKVTVVEVLESHPVTTMTVVVVVELEGE